MINETMEWLGDEALVFLNLRNSLEQSLINQDYKFYYGGMLTHKSVYEKNNKILGDHFKDILVNVELDSNKDFIICPEYTFKVYDYLDRMSINDQHKSKVFYSQECLRNEIQNDVIDGKTSSFWQIGYEILGHNFKENGIRAFETLIKCFNGLNFNGLYFRLTDKRILEGILSNISLEEKREIYKLIDICNENPLYFYEAYTNNGGGKKIANNIVELLELNSENAVSMDLLSKIADNSTSDEGIMFLYEIVNYINTNFTGIKFNTISFMPKTWDAYNSLLFDARLPNYKYAVAGGGTLLPTKFNNNLEKSGAGIGVTRLAEYAVRDRKK